MVRILRNADELAVVGSSVYFTDMSIKEAVPERIWALPDDVDVEGIKTASKERLTFILGVQEAIDSVNRGEAIPKEEVKGMIKGWVSQ